MTKAERLIEKWKNHVESHKCLWTNRCKCDVCAANAATKLARMCEIATTKLKAIADGLNYKCQALEAIERIAEGGV